jgi:hypothetical protein
LHTTALSELETFNVVEEDTTLLSMSIKSLLSLNKGDPGGVVKELVETEDVIE